MNLRIIGALVSKDFSLFFRNRFFAVITVLGLITYLVRTDNMKNDILNG